jgi:3-keto-disaccharide hydrolase
MIRCLMILALLGLGSVNSFAAEAEPGFESIFNGKDLTGWDGDPRLWSVKDGAIHGETTAENAAKGNTFLIWQDGKLKDFELRLSFRCNATNNSGIQYRSQHVEGGNKWIAKGYQHEIRNENKFPNISGFIYDEKGPRGRMAFIGETTTWSADGKKTIADKKFLDEAGFQELFKLDGWNDVVIKAEGHHLQHFMNGKLIMDCTDNDPRGYQEGILAVQLHAGKPMWVEFKDIRLKQMK